MNTTFTPAREQTWWGLDHTMQLLLRNTNEMAQKKILGQAVRVRVSLRLDPSLLPSPQDNGYVSASSSPLLCCILRLIFPPTAKLNVNELRTKKKSELLQKLNELKNELATLRVAQVTGGAPSRLAKMYLYF
jgi:ribosomal protein L29